MNTDSNRRLARRIKEIWERTGVVPLLRLPRSGPLMEWFRRNVGEIFSRENIQTVATRVLGLVAPKDALVVAKATMQARHGSGVLMQASLTYATGVLALDEASRMAEELKEKGVEGVHILPVAPEHPWVAAHLNRRKLHDDATNSWEFTRTSSLGERMRGFGLFPNKLKPGQLVGDLPLPNGVSFVVQGPPKMAGAPVRRNEPTFRPPAFA